MIAPSAPPLHTPFKLGRVPDSAVYTTGTDDGVVSLYPLNCALSIEAGLKTDAKLHSRTAVVIAQAPACPTGLA